MKFKLSALLIALGGIAANYAVTNPSVCLTTTEGKIELQLNAQQAPLSVANFTQYVQAGFYKNKIFHRVIPGFMIQGGGFDAKMTEAKTRAAIKNEASNGLKNAKYSIAMARTNEPNSATAQFFINVNNNDFLNYTSANPGYAVFGKVTQGFAVVDKIASAATATVGVNENVPVKPIVITAATLSACGK